MGKVITEETVEQVIDGDRRGRFLKERIETHRSGLGMVRKRRADGRAPRGVVLLVHGFGQNRYTFHASRRSFSSYLADAGWDVFNLDLRGGGNSQGPSTQVPLSLADHARDDVPECVRVALERSGQERLFLVGHSMGGLLAYAVAAGPSASSIAGVVAIGSPLKFGAGSHLLRAMARAARCIGPQRLARLNLPVRLDRVGRRLRARQHLWDAPWFPAPLRAWHPRSIEPEILSEYLERAFDRSRTAVIVDLFALRPDADPVPRTRATFPAVPLLVIAGSHDRLAPPESVRPAFDISPAVDKTYRTFPLGHLDLLKGREAPLTVWPAVAHWLEAHAKAQSAAAA